MSKKSRLVVLIVLLGLCFWFMWPTISWYVNTPKEDKALALSTLEYIKDYSSTKAADDVKTLKDAYKANPDAVLTADQEWLAKAAKKNLKKLGKTVPSEMTIKDALGSFGSETELRNYIEGLYREPILKNKDHYENSVKLGLDLSGGMNVIVKADLDAVVAASSNVSDVAALKAEAMAQTIETLSSRIDRFGLSSPTIRQQGEDHIYIELPGSAEADQVNSIIQGRGILNFRLVDSEANSAFQSEYNRNPAGIFDARGNLARTDLIPEDCEVLGYYVTDEYGLDQREGYLVVKKEIALEGKYITDAKLGTEEYTGRPTVNFVLDSEGAKIFGDFTGAHTGEALAIVSDSKIKSYATIRQAITGGQVQISGFGQTEAQNLKKVLQSAWLDVPLTVESQQVIGASLGGLAIRQGVLAIAVGLILIMLFMIVWYKGAGVHACISQIMNLYIMFSILSALNLTVTLPMIAGMILTIGMAVDANVIIFERIKEERRLGKDRTSSVQAGFGNALWAILDSNFTTLIAAIFMSLLGSGAVQGFAYSLAIGVISTLITSLFVSRLIFDFYTEQCKLENVSIGWGIK